LGLRGSSIVAVLSLATGLVGCSGIKGSLATDSGPGEGPWSTAPRQQVFVGETVEFSFVLTENLKADKPVHPLGVCDYCIATIGDDEMVEAELDPGGHFRFDHTFGHQSPGDVVTIQADCYLRQGAQDLMKIGDQWVRNDAPYEISDSLVASDSVALVFYDQIIKLAIDRPGSDLDMSGGRLEMIRKDGGATTVECADRTERGFTYSGPGGRGVYHVEYHPSAREISKSGATRVRFSAYDTSHRLHSIEVNIATP
jgi:hypothetical protein